MGPYMFIVFKFFDRELVLKIEDLKRRQCFKLMSCCPN